MEKEIIDYCDVCDCETPHIPLVDDIFDFALQCTKCGVIWEADNTNQIIH